MKKKINFVQRFKLIMNIVRKFKSKKKKIIITKESNSKPGYLSHQTIFGLKRKLKDFESFQVCQYNPIVGLIPIEISDIFPAAHHETSRISFDPKEFPSFEKTWKNFFANNKFSEIHYDKNDQFLETFCKNIAKRDQEKIFCLLKIRKKNVLKDSAYSAASSAQPLMKTPFL